MIECDRSGRHGVLQHRVQVAAMDVDVRTAEAALTRGVERDLIHRFAAVPGAADILLRFDAGGDERVLQPEPAQHLGGVGRQNDAGPDPRKRRRLLENFYGKA